VKDRTRNGNDRSGYGGRTWECAMWGGGMGKAEQGMRMIEHGITEQGM
jgi:hypothetical protein